VVRRSSGEKLRAGQRLATDLTMEKMLATKITCFSAAC